MWFGKAELFTTGFMKTGLSAGLSNVQRCEAPPCWTQDSEAIGLDAAALADVTAGAGRA